MWKLHLSYPKEECKNFRTQKAQLMDNISLILCFWVAC